MTKVFELLADGFEEVEALAPADILRRGGIDVTLVSISNNLLVTSAHGITVMADALISEVDLGSADLLILPGGMPGAQNLKECKALCDALVEHNAAGKAIGAICAAPMVLGSLGLLNGKKATCYPGFEGHLKGADYTEALVETDGNIITGRGPGAAMSFGYTLLSLFADEQTVADMKKGMIVI